MDHETAEGVNLLNKLRSGESVSHLDQVKKTINDNSLSEKELVYISPGRELFYLITLCNAGLFVLSFAGVSLGLFFRNMVFLEALFYITIVSGVLAFIFAISTFILCIFDGDQRTYSQFESFYVKVNVFVLVLVIIGFLLGSAIGEI